MKNTSYNREGEDSALRVFFLDALKDIYWAEKALVKALPKLADHATSEELKEALENHLDETENQIVRLEKVFAMLGEKAEGKKCPAMDGLVEESEEVVKETESGTMTRDVAIISSAQKSEHYEIATYGTLATLASIMGLPEAKSLLGQTLEEEKKADELLTRLAEGFINQSAAQEKQ